MFVKSYTGAHLAIWNPTFKRLDGVGEMAVCPRQCSTMVQQIMDIAQVRWLNIVRAQMNVGESLILVSVTLFTHVHYVSVVTYVCNCELCSENNNPLKCT